MEKERNNWSDALSEQDIPAEAVDWESIIAEPGEEELYGEAGLLDADATIGELSAEDEDE
ncbi:hypothetical protein GC101_31235 [Paenibacillus sp. LMG 31459]|uniref:Uncharacterized protein n=1 Tax=Paenibacillus phytohabitans TaxID=2654978 RepID=A0ABX1YQJ3_9BACL|nr:hypothetical protein [Paenibacillus phytohabitans]NOU83337.1 hypothetical protein [Paenibacillus phytohabitans]